MNRSSELLGSVLALAVAVTLVLLVQSSRDAGGVQRARQAPPHGLARVKVSGKWGYIDRSGRIVINPQFEEAGDFAQGLAPVKMGGKWGYIDRSGRIVINPQFEEAGGFTEGLARVKVGGKWGYVDGKGQMVIPSQFNEAGNFSRVF